MPFRRRRRRALEARLARLWRGAYVGTDSGDLAYLPAPLDFQAKRILFGGFNPPPPALGFLPPGGIAIDVGANLGEWTIPLARKAGAEGRVIAVEPNPVIARALALTLRINHLERVNILEEALSDAEGAAKLVLHAVSSGEARLGEPATDQTSLPVRTRRLDDVVSAHGITRLDFIKIDVEGHERRVLEGGIETLRRFRPAVVIESGHEGPGERETIATLFEGLGYRLIAVLHDHGALPLDFAAYRTARAAASGTEARNLLLLPEGARR